MRIAIIGHGGLPIPAPGWGAVEGIIWRRAQRLRSLGHTVDVYNTKRIDRVVAAIDREPYDFVHCHNDGFAGTLNVRLRQPYVLTSHHGWLHRFAARSRIEEAYRWRLRSSLEAPGTVALSDLIGQFYRRRGYGGFLRVLPNTVEVEHFRCASRGWRDAICLGQITARKRQALLAEATRDRVRVDFVGPWKRDRVPAFAENTTARYLGSWDRTTIEQRLTEYRCLVLLSESEAAPMVVVEALAAGLSVVVSEAAAANLDAEEFVTVLPVAETRPDVISDAIQAAIDDNRWHRASIRDHAFARFDEAVGTRDYLQMIDEFRAQTELTAAFHACGWAE